MHLERRAQSEKRRYEMAESKGIKNPLILGLKTSANGSRLISLIKSK